MSKIIVAQISGRDNIYAQIKKRYNGIFILYMQHAENIDEVEFFINEEDKAWDPDRIYTHNGLPLTILLENDRQVVCKYVGREDTMPIILSKKDIK